MKPLGVEARRLYIAGNKEYIVKKILKEVGPKVIWIF